MPARSYSSPLRERQAQQTRDAILDTLTELLGAHRADEITTRDLARASGVSERTVYRHFPDREALLAGLSNRLADLSETGAPRAVPDSIDGLPQAAVALMATLDEHHVAARGGAVERGSKALLGGHPREHPAVPPDARSRAARARRARTGANRGRDEVPAVGAGLVADAGGVRRTGHRVRADGGVGAASDHRGHPTRRPPWPTHTRVAPWRPTPHCPVRSPVRPGGRCRPGRPCPR